MKTETIFEQEAIVDFGTIADEALNIIYIGRINEDELICYIKHRLSDMEVPEIKLAQLLAAVFIEEYVTAKMIKDN